VVDFDLFIGLVLQVATVPRYYERKKKAGVTEHPEVFGHVGVLGNGPPGKAGLPFVSSTNTCKYQCTIMDRENKWTGVPGDGRVALPPDGPS
jgi:hypothetical protein